MDGLPGVSCMCLTYGRPAVLEEAIESFRRQDYAGPKELIVLNDFDRQTLLCDVPGVHVVNVSKRFRTVGEKRNACAALATHDLLFVWDDDDIYLPHRLSFSVRMFNPEKGFFKPSKALTLNSGQIGGPNANLYHSGSCFSRSLFDKARGYAHMGSGQDFELETVFERLIGRGKNFNAIKPEEIYYIYRWSGTGSYHLSGFGKDKTGEIAGNAKVAGYVQKQIEGGTLPVGTVSLAPHWKLDYPTMAKEYVAGLPQRTVV
ncbi:MAG: glycosyltransferase family 2 protein [Planctomycetes bacterium]|nr:glycosyltransferase family 2 protein [Planctomycetota bacterium]